MKKLLLSAGIWAASSMPAFADDVSSLVSLVTSPQPQIQLMSMVLTVQAAQRGVDVHVLLCGAAGDMALKDAPESVTAGQPPLNVSPQSFMEILRQNENVSIQVCALYLPGIGKDQSALLSGIGIASPGDMAAILVEGDARVLSL
jgi:hypothetical protein